MEKSKLFENIFAKLWFLLFFGMGLFLLIGNANQYYDAFQSDPRLLLIMSYQGYLETIVYATFFITISFVGFKRCRVYAILALVIGWGFLSIFQPSIGAQTYSDIREDRFVMFKKDLSKKCPFVPYEAHEAEVEKISKLLIWDLDWKQTTNFQYFVASDQGKRYEAGYRPNRFSCGDIEISIANENTKELVK